MSGTVCRNCGRDKHTVFAFFSSTRNRCLEQAGLGLTDRRYALSENTCSLSTIPCSTTPSTGPQSCAYEARIEGFSTQDEERDPSDDRADERKTPKVSTLSFSRPTLSYPFLIGNALMNTPLDEVIPRPTICAYQVSRYRIDLVPNGRLRSTESEDAGAKPLPADDSPYRGRGSASRVTQDIRPRTTRRRDANR